MRRTFVIALLCSLAALPSSAAERRTPQAAGLPAGPAAPASGLTVYTDYQDHAVVETYDAARRLLSRVVEGGTHFGREAGHADDSHDAADARAAASSPSAASRCSNSGSWEEFSGGNPTPWRMSEPFHVNPSGAPSHRVGDWRNQILLGKTLWEQFRNQCGYGDWSIWDAPVSWDTSTWADASCGSADGVNLVGFANMNGWTSEGLVLARTCVWWSSDFIYESDVMFNTHNDAKWANGAVAGYWDLQSVAAHEFGHALGLGHVENGASRETAAAVMHPIVYTGDTRNRTLSRGDMDGVMALYPRLWGYEIVSSRLDNPAGDGQRLEPNRTYTVTVDVENTGWIPWRVGDPYSVTLATYPAGRCSTYAASDWPSCKEASWIDADATDAGGGPENPASVVAQGEIARFSFQVPVTWAREGTVSFEGFRVRGMPVPDAITTIPVDVGTYKMSVTGTSGPGSIVPSIVVRGTPAVASVTVRNDGTAPWLPGDRRIALVTDPAGRTSRWRGRDWISATVVTPITTPESVVRPGEQATFRFSFSTPFDTHHGTRYTMERFDVEIAGRPTSRMNAKTAFYFEIW